jgi:regulator of protease activity HflC (stomatin/prohibitin superfamily)
MPACRSIAGRSSRTACAELEISVESKTKDDVFVDLLIAVQFYVKENDESVKAAFYKLMNPQQQISSYVFDTVRALVPDMPSTTSSARRTRSRWR